MKWERADSQEGLGPLLSMNIFWFQKKCKRARPEVWLESVLTELATEIRKYRLT